MTFSRQLSNSPTKPGPLSRTSGSSDPGGGKCQKCTHTCRVLNAMVKLIIRCLSDLGTGLWHKPVLLQLDQGKLNLPGKHLQQPLGIACNSPEVKADHLVGLTSVFPCHMSPSRGPRCPRNPTCSPEGIPLLHILSPPPPLQHSQPHPAAPSSAVPEWPSCRG